MEMYASLTFLVLYLFNIVQPKVLDEDMFLYWRRSDSTKCAPFTTYYISCNKCVCSADGTGFCTRMACFKKPFPGFLLADESKNISPVDKPDGDDSSNVIQRSTH